MLFELFVVLFEFFPVVFFEFFVVLSKLSVVLSKLWTSGKVQEVKCDESYLVKSSC